jgi:glutaconyl-CoA/methylmalonyl-CoA decarboxylase subunit delta
MSLSILNDFLNGLLISFFSILVVFLILYLITLSVEPLKSIKDKVSNSTTPAPETVKKFTIEDIKDEDMMVAALVASIDMREASHTDVRVISIKEIN